MRGLNIMKGFSTLNLTGTLITCPMNLLEGPPIPITIDMVKTAISKMKSGKAAGPSGIVVEMIKAAGDTGATMIRDLATAIIRDGKVPTDWEESFIVCLYKGKGDALDRGN